MIFKIFNFSNASCLPVIWEKRADAAKLCDWDKQCVVSVASTPEDLVYMEIDELWCDHVLHPNSCTFCNPAWRRVYELEAELRELRGETDEGVLT